MNPHLVRLLAERVLTSPQAQYIHGHWQDSPGDLWAQPQVRKINDHTRAYIDQLRGHFRAAIPFEEQDGGEING